MACDWDLGFGLWSELVEPTARVWDQAGREEQGTRVWPTLLLALTIGTLCLRTRPALCREKDRRGTGMR